MPYGMLLLVGTLNSASTNPLEVISPILLPYPVNQRLPSGPVVMLTGRLLAVGMVNSSAVVMVPAVVIRPILPDANSVNQRLPSGPAVIANGRPPSVVTSNSSAAVMTPAVLIRPIFPALNSVNQRLPSGPTVMPVGPLFGVGTGNSAETPLATLRRPI